MEDCLLVRLFLERPVIALLVNAADEFRIANDPTATLWNQEIGIANQSDLLAFNACLAFEVGLINECVALGYEL